MGALINTNGHLIRQLLLIVFAMLHSLNTNRCVGRLQRGSGESGEREVNSCPGAVVDCDDDDDGGCGRVFMCLQTNTGAQCRLNGRVVILTGSKFRRPVVFGEEICHSTDSWRCKEGCLPLVIR